MNQLIVESEHSLTLVGGGDATPEVLHEALRLAPLCVAADGGAALALAAGVEPRAVIGDFDSVSPDDLARIPSERLHRIAEQESTDFEKALMRVRAPLILGVGFLGGRVDHQLAALHVLMAHPHRPCLLIAEKEIICLAPPRFSLSTEPGHTLSLFPLGQVTGRSRGLEWPIEGISFGPGQRIGTSNRTTGALELEMEAPRMLLILPKALMQLVAAHLADPQTARWPAPPG